MTLWRRLGWDCSVRVAVRYERNHDGWSSGRLLFVCTRRAMKVSSYLIVVKIAGISDLGSIKWEDICKLGGDCGGDRGEGDLGLRAINPSGPSYG